MIGNMAQVHMTEAELARNLHAVLEKVRNGAEVVIEQDHQAVAVIKMPQAPGRPIDECIAIARARDSHATLDEDFAAGLEEIIASRKPLDTSAWE
jgi:antitoxin (DNA-binding transcriptional repressor) of toxin-antitoxin stability system